MRLKTLNIHIVSLEEVVSLRFVEDASVPTPLLVILFFLPLPERFNSEVSPNLAVTFPERDARQNYNDVPQSPPILASGIITVFKIKQASRGESITLEEVCYTTKECSEYVSRNTHGNGL